MLTCAPMVRVDGYAGGRDRRHLCLGIPRSPAEGAHRTANPWASCGPPRERCSGGCMNMHQSSAPHWKRGLTPRTPCPVGRPRRHGRSLQATRLYQTPCVPCLNAFSEVLANPLTGFCQYSQKHPKKQSRAGVLVEAHTRLQTGPRRGRGRRSSVRGAGAPGQVRRSVPCV